MMRAFTGCLVCATLALALDGVARGEGLGDAIALVYQTNPTLQAQRALLKEADEGYAQARAALGPTITLQGLASDSQTRFGYLSPQLANNGQVQVTIAQPLYSGGRNALNISAAAARIEEARQSLRSVEGDVLQTVIQAYVDVVRDAAYLKVREDNIGVLDSEVKESVARERDGEITSTDVAQARAQFAAEEALLATARGQLETSRISYAAVVGQNPGTLEPPPLLPGLPRVLEQAFSDAEENSPELLRTRFVETESADRVRIARAAGRPTVSLGVTAGYSGPVDPFREQTVQRSVSGQVTITQPIFTNGLNASVVRQALDQDNADLLGIEAARRTTLQSVANAWNQMIVGEASAAAQERNVEAAQAAFTGMRIEQRAGQRATLDVLITQQNLVNARLLLLAAVHDRYAAEAALLRAIGRLEGGALLTNLPAYDPAVNLHRVAGRGMVPWTSLAQAIDSVGAPGLGQRSSVRPASLADAPVFATATPPPPGDLATALPMPPAADLGVLQPGRPKRRP